VKEISSRSPLSLLIVSKKDYDLRSVQLVLDETVANAFRYGSCMIKQYFLFVNENFKFKFTTAIDRQVIRKPRPLGRGCLL